MSNFLQLLSKLFDLINLFFNKKQEEDRLVEKAVEKQKDIDSITAVAVKAESEDPKIKKEGIDEMRLLISD